MTDSFLHPKGLARNTADRRGVGGTEDHRLSPKRRVDKEAANAVQSAIHQRLFLPRGSAGSQPPGGDNERGVLKERRAAGPRRDGAKSCSAGLDRRVDVSGDTN